MTVEVAVIGSGLSAMGAIRALRRVGIIPTVIDCGEKLDPQQARLAEALSRKSPATWSDQERQELGRNLTVAGSSIPRKLVFGSDYFYGRSRKDAPVAAEGNLPPFSYALGGFSAGWGAATLPPDACDLNDWPVDADEIIRYCRLAIEDLPYSAASDGLSLNFPVLADDPKALRLSTSDRSILERLRSAMILEKDQVVFGQSRLLTNPDPSSGCRYCGQCMSGCVFDAIYKTSDEVLRLSRVGAVDYKAGCLVREITEIGERVAVKYLDHVGHETTQAFDRVFVAAGAVNSTRIVLKSLRLFDRKVRLKTRGGYVLPVFSFRRLPIDWPYCNTQPGIFLEFKGGPFAHWVHVQISTANELLFQKLKVRFGGGGPLARLKKYLVEHVMLLFVNFHSDHAGHYDLWMTPPVDQAGADCLHSRHRLSRSQWLTFARSVLRLMEICWKIGCLPIVFLAKNNSGSYHVGGSLPMKAVTRDELDTDDLGRVSAWRRVHIVDTSTFPSLPGTTIGLLAMANAMRIVEKIRWEDEV